jgi:hypothetical protein
MAILGAVASLAKVRIPPKGKPAPVQIICEASGGYEQALLDAL